MNIHLSLQLCRQNKLHTERLYLLVYVISDFSVLLERHLEYKTLLCYHIKKPNNKQHWGGLWLCCDKMWKVWGIWRILRDSKYSMFERWDALLIRKCSQQNKERFALLQKAVQAHKKNTHNVRSTVLLYTLFFQLPISFITTHYPFYFFRQSMDRLSTDICSGWKCRVLKIWPLCLRYSWTPLMQ